MSASTVWLGRSAYLIVLIESFKVSNLHELPYFFVTQSDAVVEITQPDHRFMVVNGAVSLKPQSVANGLVVAVPLFVIGEASREMGRHETDGRVCKLHPDRHGAFVTSHAGHARL